MVDLNVSGIKPRVQVDSARRSNKLCCPRAPRLHVHGAATASLWVREGARKEGGKEGKEGREVLSVCLWPRPPPSLLRRSGSGADSASLLPFPRRPPDPLPPHPPKGNDAVARQPLREWLELFQRPAPFWTFVIKYI